MFITVCGWIFCIAVFISLIVLAIEVILEDKDTTYSIPCDPKKNSGICARRASSTWYGYHLKTTTGQRKIIWRKLFINCAFSIFPIIWACIVFIFAI